MTKRPYFIIGDLKKTFFIEKEVEFEFFTGFAITQKQKSIRSFHAAILNNNPSAKILEVSRKSENILGTKLSAFNLKITYKNGSTYPVENVFQSAKVFENGGPYVDLLKVNPADAKRDERLKTSGKLVCFQLGNTKWDLEPRTMFYDFLYLSALRQNSDLGEELLNYDCFTDIEFNPKKSINCQARSVAIFVTLVRHNLLNKYLTDLNLFKSMYIKEQMETDFFLLYK